MSPILRRRLLSVQLLIIYLTTGLFAAPIPSVSLRGLITQPFSTFGLQTETSITAAAATSTALDLVTRDAPASAPPDPPSSALSTGAKAGISIAAAILAFALIILVVSIIQKRQQARAGAIETSYIYGPSSGTYAQVANGAPMVERGFARDRDPETENYPDPIELLNRQKPAVALTATVHPGELGAWERY